MGKVYRTKSAEETEALGEALGRRLVSGDLVLLYGDLGTGKTTFVKGLARGLGVPEETYVVSPSLALINEYEGRVPLYHVDLYRLSPEEVEDLGLWDLLSRGVMVVEWAERLEDAPPPRFRVHFVYLSADEREIRLEGEMDDDKIQPLRKGPDRDGVPPSPESGAEDL